MNYKNLGNTDLKVSTICLGTMTWGEQNTEQEGFEQMDFALDQGVNFWDTKVAGPARDYLRNGENSFVGKKIEDVLTELLKYIKSGKIRYVGLSNETPWGVNKFLQLSKELNLPRMMSVQNPYSLLNRSYEVGLAEISIRDEIGCLAYSPLASGYLTGKYRNGQLPKGSRIERDGDFWTRYQKPNMENAVEEYYKIAKKYNVNLAQMSLKFCEIQPFMTSVIIGATTMEQLKENIESVNINLTNDLIKDLNEIQKIYPNPCP